MVPAMLERRFPRTFGSLEDIYAFIRAFLAGHAIDAEHAWDLDVIIEELFTNMVKYGGSSDRPIEIALGWQSPTLTLRLRDFGAADFNPTLAPEVDIHRPITERRAGGLGIHLVRQLADSLVYSHLNGDSTLTVTKRLET